MVKTKSIRDPIEASDGKRILVMRHWARPYSRAKLQVEGEGQWLRNLAPSESLLKDWKNQAIDWEEYVKRFYEEMAHQHEFIAALAKEAMTGTITLLCQEDEDDPHCHRHLLKNMIEDAMKV